MKFRGLRRFARNWILWLAPPMLLVAGAPVVHAEAAATRHALLIGINEYQNVPDLRGALNDVELLRGVLISRFAFPEAQVVTLTDEAAGRAGIFAAIAAIAERAAPADLVYVHYSGHGSQVGDRNGDESDGRDETIIPQDGRTEGIRDISDDELGEALAAIKSQALIVVLDSCHSGTATRGTRTQPRSVPADTRWALYEDTATRAVVPIATGNHLLITGAADTEEALDGPVDGRSHGLFSYAFARALSASDDTASARDVLALAERQLERIKAQLGLTTMPEPQLEAAAEILDLPLMGARPAAGSETARFPWLGVRAEPGGVRLLAGRQLGAVAGSIWAIFPPGELEFAPGDALAEAHVERLEGDDAVARIQPAGILIPESARATVIAPPMAAEQLPVRLLVTDPGRLQALSAAVRARLPNVLFAEAGDFARFVVQVEASSTIVYAADGTSISAEFMIEDDDALATALAAAFSRSMTAAELLSLDHPASRIELELELTHTGEGRNESAPVFAMRAPGEPRAAHNSLQVRVETNRDCFLTLVDVDAEGHLQILLPNPIAEARGFIPGGAIQAGAPVLIPDSLAAGNAAGFYVDYAPPPGIDTLRAFCTTNLEGARALRATLAPLTRAGTSGETIREAVREIRGVLSRASSRGVRIVADGAEAVLPEPARPAAEPLQPQAPEPFDWTATSLVFEVGP